MLFRPSMKIEAPPHLSTFKVLWLSRGLFSLSVVFDFGDLCTTGRQALFKKEILDISW